MNPRGSQNFHDRPIKGRSLDLHYKLQVPYFLDTTERSKMGKDDEVDIHKDDRKYSKYHYLLLISSIGRWSIFLQFQGFGYYNSQ